MNPAPAEIAAALAELRDPSTIRARCEAILGAGLDGKLEFFRIEPDRLVACAAYVVAVMRERHPDLRIPYHSRWRHFVVDGDDRAAFVTDVRARFDLAVVSVLLDAGAGPAWRYVDRTQRRLARSEALAVASLEMFAAGLFSAKPGEPLRVDAERLSALTEAELARGFAVSADNPLVGLAGRLCLLHGLAEACRAVPALFLRDGAYRPGNLASYLRERARDEHLPARVLLDAVLAGFSSIWPGRASLGGVNLGDVWPHPAAGGEGLTRNLVPFHKLSQWLTYSLIEPLEQAGLVITDVPALTGLAEYRNGGLLMDLGVIVPRDPSLLVRAHEPGSTVIVEWRALTLALLDRLAIEVRRQLGVGEDALPLPKILEGGTWVAGRKIAATLRPGGAPPITLASDGTVF